MTQTPPDRLSNNPKSPHYDASVLEKGVGVRFNGVEKTTVEEYCVSEGWVRLAVGKTLDRHGARLRSSCAAWSSHISKPISGKRDAQSPGVVLSVDINEGSNDIGSFFVPTTWLQLARTAIASTGRLGSDQMQTGHAVGTVDPPHVTRSGRPLCVAAAEWLRISNAQPTELRGSVNRHD
jgi:hypothetical protein